MPGPLAAARLVAAGATLTKIEPPQGDALKLAAPAWYAHLVRGQKILQLDLREAKARERLDAELDRADVLLTASRLASLARFNLTRESVAARWPTLCYVAIVGEAGPDANAPGHDLTYQAKAGLLHEPRVPSILAADILGAERAVCATFELLLHRERSGCGSHREVSLLEAARAFVPPIEHGLTAPGGTLGGGSPLYNVYKSRDGYIALAAIEPQFRERLLKELALADETTGLTRAFSEHDSAHWERWGRAHDIPLAALAPESS